MAVHTEEDTTRVFHLYIPLNVAETTKTLKERISQEPFSQFS